MLVWKNCIAKLKNLIKWMDFGQFKDSVSKNSYSVRKVNFKLYIQWIENTNFCDSNHLRLDFSFHYGQWRIITNRSCLGKNDSMNLRVIDFRKLWEHQVEIVHIWASVFIEKNSFQGFLQTNNINDIWAELNKVIKILSDRNLNDRFSNLWADCFENEFVCLLDWRDFESWHI